MKPIFLNILIFWSYQKCTYSFKNNLLFNDFLFRNSNNSSSNKNNKTTKTAHVVCSQSYTKMS